MNIFATAAKREKTIADGLLEVEPGGRRSRTLTEAISDYRAGIEEFNRLTLHDDDMVIETIAHEAYDRHLKTLIAWHSPAESYPAALDALQISLEELEEADDDFMPKSLTAAALAFLKKRSDELVWLIDSYEEIELRRRVLKDAMEAFEFDDRRPGYDLIHEEEARLFGAASWMEERICGLPCHSVRDVLAKAAFAGKWLEDDGGGNERRGELLETISAFAMNEQL